MSNSLEKSPFLHIDLHIEMVGVVVRDMNKVIKRLTSLGIGPFVEYKTPAPRKDRILRGKSVEGKVNIMLTKMGQVELQLQQPLEGQSLQKEILDRKGEGLFYLGFYVDDINKEVENLAKKGITPVMEGSTTEGRFFAFFEIEDTGGILVELVQRPKK